MNGVMIVLATVLIAPLPLVPFTNTFPPLRCCSCAWAWLNATACWCRWAPHALGGLYVSGIFFALFHAGSWLGSLLAPVVQFFGGS
jgi:hypothetical protein